MTPFNLLAFSAVLVTIFFVSPDSSASQDFIEIKRIAMTKLFTGLWYTIDLKLNNGRLSWSYTIIEPSSVKANHVQVVFDKAVIDFQPGEVFWNDTQWMFGPSEKSELYFIYNKGIPHVVLTWAGGDAEKKFVGLDQNFDNPDYKEGGKYRTDTLWFITPNLDDYAKEFYNIYNARFLSSGSGIMTISDQGIAEGKKHVEVYVSKNGEKGGHPYLLFYRYLWKITPSHPIDSSALIEQLSNLKGHEQYLCGKLDTNKAEL